MVGERDKGLLGRERESRRIYEREHDRGARRVKRCRSEDFFDALFHFGQFLRRALP